MTGEIDRDFYCSADCLETGRNGINVCGNAVAQDAFNWSCNDYCRNHHRKHPTPEQFLNEYGREYPDDWAVYSFFDDGQGWVAGTLSWAKEDWCSSNPIVCACTPFGKPPDDWRPE